MQTKNKPALNKSVRHQTTSFLFKNIFNVNVHSYVPEQDNLQRTMILLPAIGVDIKKYAALIVHLTANGFSVIAADYPGCGESFPRVARGLDYNYADLIEFFIPQLISQASISSQQNPILLGHSLGGHLASLYALNHQATVIAVASGNIGYKNWDTKGKINILRAVVLFRALITIYGYLPGKKIGFGKREAASLMKDWCTTVVTGNYQHIVQASLPSKNRNLFINIRHDDWAPLQSTQQLATLFFQPQVIELTSPDSAKGNQHSAWIKQPEFIVNEIIVRINAGQL